MAIKQQLLYQLAVEFNRSDLNWYYAGQKLTLNDTIYTLSFLMRNVGPSPGSVGFGVMRWSDKATLASKILGLATSLAGTWTWYTVTLDTPLTVNEQICIFVYITELTAGTGGVYTVYTDHSVVADENMVSVIEGVWNDWSPSVDLAYSINKNPNAEASVTTQPASYVTKTTAVGNGNVTALGVPIATQYGHVWVVASPSTDSPSRPNIITDDENKTEKGAPSATGAYTSTAITGLTAGTKYYLKAYITDSYGTHYGERVEFTTSPASIPTLTTQACSSITDVDAVGNGTVVAVGDSAITESGHCWKLASLGHTPTILDSHSHQGAIAAPTPFTSAITPLAAFLLYYVRAYVTTSVDTYYGNEVECVTSGGLPLVTTQLVTSITDITAVGNLTLVNNGGSLITQYGVVYGMVTLGNPGNVLPSVSGYDSYTEEGADTIMGTKTSDISGLSSTVTYYVRAYATNTTGTTYGDEVSFITKILGAPTVVTEPMTDIESTSAYGHGTIVDIGMSAVTEHGHVWGTSPHPTTAGSKTAFGAGSVGLTFASYLASLTNGTTYYVRAYATNTQGTSYGDNVTFTAGEVAVYPTNPITRVTSITHYYNRGNYSMKMGLGDVIADIGIPDLGGTSRRPGTIVPSLTAGEEATRIEEIDRLSAELQRIIAAASVTGGILTSYARSVLIQRAIEIKAQIDALNRM